jgi:hypothetical protein
MSTSVKSRAHRILRKLSQFKECDRIDELPQLVGEKSPLSKTETCVGAYENVSKAKEDLLLFTDLGAHRWAEGKWISVRYSDIVGTRWPTEEKSKATELWLETKLGSDMYLPVRGGTEVTRDLFEVMRFFDRVIEDQKAEGKRGKSSMRSAPSKSQKTP